MKAKDIVVGKHYACAASSYETPRQVEVLETGVAIREDFGRRTARKGVKVRWLGGSRKGTESTVLSRTILEPWAGYSKRQQELYKAEMAARQQRLMLLADRARYARELAQILEGHGEPLRRSHVYGAEERAALEAEGFKTEANAGPYTYLSRVRELSDFMAGRVSLDDVRVLLADAAL